MTVRHVQRQRIAAPAFAGMVLSGLALLAAGLVPGVHPGLRAAFLGGAGLVLLLFLEFERLTIVVTDRELVAGFRLFKSRTPIEDVESAKPIRVRLFAHGVGLHWTLSGALAFTARTGPGVEVARRGRARLILSCDDPDALVRALSGAAP